MDACVHALLFGLLIAIGGASPCIKVNTTTYAVQKGNSKYLDCSLCSSRLPCYWATFSDQCMLQENVSCVSSTCRVTINSNADAKLLHCCSNSSFSQPASPPLQCFAVHLCLYGVSLSLETAVSVGLPTTTTVVLSGYPLPEELAPANFVSQTSILDTKRVVPPDEANVTYVYTIQASSNTNDTFNAYYRNKNVCSDYHVSYNIFPTFQSEHPLPSPVTSSSTSVSPMPSLLYVSISDTTVVQSHNSFSSLKTTLPHSSTSDFTNIRFVKVTVGLSISIVLAAMFLFALVVVFIKLKAYDVCLSSSNRISVLKQRTNLLTITIPTSVATEEPYHDMAMKIP